MSGQDRHSPSERRSRSNSGRVLIPIFAAIVVILAAALAGYYFIFRNSAKTVSPLTPKKTSEVYFKKNGELAFLSTAGDTIRKIDIEIAESALTRQLGLMYREDMNDDRGMLFIFPAQHEQAFWMKNTYISLDMIFVNNLLEIVTIHEKAIPFSQDPYYSYDPAIYVIEVVAGFTQKYGITAGDKVSWKRTYATSQ